MGRPLRIEYPDAFYHITSRGNERKSIFRSERDYGKFTGYLESATESYGARIHCFCLMPNHYHLPLETPRANLRAILHHLNTSYTNYFNIKHQRAGHLFQGRYRAIWVEKDAYALELSGYIHLNPVRAQLVEGPRQYFWSSDLAYVKGGQRWGWLETEFILGQVGGSETESRRKYEDFVEDGIQYSPPDPLKNVVASTLLGSDRFIEWVRRKWIGKTEADRDLPALRKLSIRPDLSSIVREVEKVFGSGTIESRRVVLYLSHRLSGLSLREIGSYFDGISSSRVSQNTRRLEERMKGDRKLFEKVNQLKTRVSQ